MLDDQIVGTGLSRRVRQPYETRKREQDKASSRQFALILAQHHYCYASKEMKDRHLPVPLAIASIRIEARKPRKVLATPKVLITPQSRHNFDGFEVKPGTQLKTILLTVTHYYRTRECDILGERRTANLITPRHVCFYLACLMSDASISRIGKYFRRDHTVVLYAREVIGRKMDADPILALQVRTIKAQIEALESMPAVDHVAALRARASKAYFGARRRIAP